MKAIKISLWSLLAALTALWFSQPSAYPASFSLLSIRSAIIDYSGILSMGAMSATMILATRAKWFESWLNGLDKSFRLHKWLGITALITSISHWFIVNLPKWMVSLGLMARPEHKGPIAGAGDTSTLTTTDMIQSIFRDLRPTAEGLGEYAFYLAALLMILALIKYFPYKRFLQTHTLLAITYLVLVAHSVILFPFELWLHPLGILMGTLMIGGVISAVLILARLHGKASQTKGMITALLQHPNMKTLSITVKVDGDWKGHKAGQFAFVSFDDKEGKHPFTMASDWDDQSHEITFLIKELGDYTSQMSSILVEGDPVTIEGPYGHFTFEDGNNRQIWVGAGIGITPFIARMKQLTKRRSNQTIDLFHVTAAISPDLEEQLKADAKKANIQLHLIIDKDGTGFSADKLDSEVPGWKDAGLWFCGPAQMGKILKSKLSERGLDGGAFHQELFEMR
ncbi:ferredoxin reductase family protein [Cohaesibacter celericrescens]|uniref:Ferric reductase n=1 Tax=Cohaesibacter celericrescens TaxID=2067669 RepID=A0A2N5XRU6_9HYPH|nr:ferric reductase-like transmembrane domain-containing protein [Cohaesibacter celericrescens]PLW77246.1 ferric reductase [Cohaesibacter celericrescens]